MKAIKTVFQSFGLFAHHGLHFVENAMKYKNNNAVSYRVISFEP